MAPMRVLTRALVILTLALSVLAGACVPSVTATEPNRWAYLFTEPSTGVRANLALGAATTGQVVYVAVGGSELLDIVQIGAKREPDGRRHLFAAWGRGTPFADGSLYVERDLGPVGTGLHSYALRLRDGVWRMFVDGVVRLRVSDAFRTWTRRNVTAANEAEYGGALGGTLSSPVRITGARVWRSGAWRLPAFGRWYVGGYRVPAATRSSQGTDWLRVWRQ